MSTAARLRGLATGALTATLAVAAHGAAGGGLPSGAAIAELALVAATVGAIAFTTAAGPRGLVLLLGAGQLVGHLLLGAAGHSHSTDVGAPAALMLTAHVVAVLLGALLIAVGEHLCSALSRAIGAARATTSRFASVATVVVIRNADQPMRRALLLAASMSHRGPPVRTAF